MKIIKCTSCGAKFRYRQRERLVGLRGEGPHPGYRGESGYYPQQEQERSINCPNYEDLNLVTHLQNKVRTIQIRSVFIVCNDL